MVILRLKDTWPLGFSTSVSSYLTRVSIRYFKEQHAEFWSRLLWNILPQEKHFIYLWKLKMDTILKRKFLHDFFLLKSNIKQWLRTLPLTVAEMLFYTLITDAQKQRHCVSHLQICHFSLSLANEIMLIYKKLFPPNFPTWLFKKWSSKWKTWGLLKAKPWLILYSRKCWTAQNIWLCFQKLSRHLRFTGGCTCRLHNPFLSSQNSIQLLKRHSLLWHCFLAWKNNLDKHFEASFCTTAKTATLQLHLECSGGASL